VRYDRCSIGAALKFAFSAVFAMPKNLRRLLHQLERQEQQAKQITSASPAQSVDEAMRQIFGER
jgi:hypothetical protein